MTEHTETCKCVKCGKPLTEDQAWPWPSINTNTGGRSETIYCEADSNALFERIYGVPFSEEEK